jgi:hypothetical protein
MYRDAYGVEVETIRPENPFVGEWTVGDPA